MGRSAVVFAMAIGTVSCSSPVVRVERTNIALQQADGSYDLFAGSPETMSLLEKGGIADEKSSFDYYLLHVPGEFVSAALATGVRSISLENPYNGVLLTVHTRRPDTSAGASRNATVLSHIVAHPGDPWTSGIAQVYADARAPSDLNPSPIGLFDLILYEPNPELSRKWNTIVVSRAEIRNGDVDDPNGLPMLLFANPNPSTWPALPTGWAL